jgi:hypothetical protein
LNVLKGHDDGSYVGVPKSIEILVGPMIRVCVYILEGEVVDERLDLQCNET